MQVAVANGPASRQPVSALQIEAKAAMTTAAPTWPVRAASSADAESFWTTASVEAQCAIAVPCPSNFAIVLSLPSMPPSAVVLYALGFIALTCGSIFKSALRRCADKNRAGL